MVMGNRGNVPIRLSNVAMEHDPFMDVPMTNHEHLYKGGEVLIATFDCWKVFFLSDTSMWR